MDNQDPLVIAKHTLNPYFDGARMILRRLRWDMNYAAWTSRKKLKNLKNCSWGKKAIILCNGPSLNKVDFNLIGSNIFTFGLNKINLLFDRSTFRPSCIVAVNPFVIKQNSEFFNSTDIPLFLNSVGKRYGWIHSRKKNLVFLYCGASTNVFAKDCSINVNQGFTVTYVALQLAFHMGFREVALVGADHTFATNGPANKTVKGSETDASHFDPRYFSNVKWQLPDLFESEVSYTRAKNMYNAHDRKIFNCTDGGKLDVFDRVSLSTFLSGS